MGLSVKKLSKRPSLPKPGDFITTPLSDKVECVGVVLNVARPFIVTAFLNYLVPVDSREYERSKIVAADVHDVFVHGPLGFDDGWMIRGQLANFDRAEWPPLEFYSVNQKRVVELDHKTLQLESYICQEENIDHLPEDGVCGHEYISQLLAIQLLGVTFEDVNKG